MKKAPCLVRLNGSELAEGSGYGADLDLEGGKLWLTLDKTLPQGAAQFEINSECDINPVKP